MLRGLLTPHTLPTQPRQPHKLALFLFPNGGTMRHITPAGLGLIKQFEGFSPTVYICPAGYPTIGYGHVVKLQEREQFARGITTEQAETLLRQDLQTAERAVLPLITVPLTDGQFDALVSFTFNLGAGALQRSTLRRKVNRSDHAAVPAEFRKWVWAGGRKLEGLILRREAEIVRYRLV
jgi:lysozyme